MREVTGVIATSTIKTPYEVLRELSATDDTSLTAANLKDGLSGGLVTKLNAAEIVMFGTNAENETLSWTLYLQAKDAAAELVGIGQGALGDVEAGLGASTLFANVLVITTQKWINSLKVVAGDNVSLYTSKLLLDCFGYDKIELKMSKNASAASVGALIRWF